MVAAVNASGGLLSTLVGLMTLRLTIEGTFQRYVRGGMQVWLLIAGVALLVLGGVALVRALRGHDAEQEGSGDGHHESGRLGVGWLLLVPVTALLLVAPPSLGSYGVDRALPVRITSQGGGFDPLPRSGSPVEMSLLEYTERAFDGNGDSLRDATVALTGFVADGADASSFRLARYQIACCAADAAAAVVRVIGFGGAAPPRDQWVTVVGRFQAAQGETPVLEATSIQEIKEPVDPYE
jgi:uncharacterized repeat protein (TIGR03943 family)